MPLHLNIALACVFIQVAITLLSVYSTGRLRLAALRDTELHIREIAVETTRYPLPARLHQNNMQNQFETPPLLYAAVALAAALGVSSWPFAIAAVVYVAFRIAHRVVHTGSNNVTLRFKLFAVSYIALAALWLILAYSIFVNT